MLAVEQRAFGVYGADEIGRLAIVVHQNVDDGRLHERQLCPATLRSERGSSASSVRGTVPPSGRHPQLKCELPVGSSES